MGELYAYDGSTHLTTVREGSTSFTTRAELGQPGSGSFTIEDTAGTIRIVGQKDFLHTESSCATATTFRGFVADRTYGRDAGEGGKQYTGAGRNIAVDLEDLNSMLGFRGIDGTDRKRDAETVAERGAWLMASDYVSGLFVDNGRCDFSASKGMDKADYTDQFPGDVLADMALAQTGVNYHVNDWGAGAELTFRDDNASTDDTCTLRISNVLSDASSVTLNPSYDASMVVSPGRVKSKLTYQYAKGRVTPVPERTATATAFNGERFGTASNSNVKTSAKASDEADAMLWQLHTEDVHVECYVEVTSAQVNLILAGMRIQAKFSHLPDYGYDSFTWFRIMERTVEPIVADAGIYRVKVRLSPQEDAEPAASIVQSAFGYISLGAGTLSLPNPVTIGNLLVFVISARSTPTPSSPNITTSHPRWGAGAWTKDPNTTVRYGSGSGGGVAIWYKTADATDQTGYVPVTESLIGIYEIAGGDIGSATTTYETLQSAANPMTIGSLGTAADGSVAILVGNWNDSSLVPPTDPTWTGTANGWVLDRIQTVPGVYPRWGPPVSYCAHALGDGSSLTASGTRGGLYFMDGKWCGVAILIPPL